MNRTIHVVCFDCPSPPDYGGAIDMFYAIRALHETGEKIILHYFDYKPQRTTAAIEPFCAEIHAYRRKNLFQSLPLTRPFIVQSRINEELIHRLNEDEHPVLLEGLHCSGIAPFLHRKERVIIRLHNNEAAYYHHLAKAERTPLKRTYFLQESRLLKGYQKQLDKNLQLACLSEADLKQFRSDYQFRSLSFVPCFLPWQNVNAATGKGDYCLYHGNLSVAENSEAALWLIEKVFSQIQTPLVIAGKGASKRLKAASKKHSRVMLVEHPPEDELNALIRDAHIHVLPSFNNTGVKLKLLHALFQGRFCVTNENGINGTGIHQGVAVKNTPVAWISEIETLMATEFTARDLEERTAILRLYNNQSNARQLSALWLHYQ